MVIRNTFGKVNIKKIFIKISMRKNKKPKISENEILCTSSEWRNVSTEWDLGINTTSPRGE